MQMSLTDLWNHMGWFAKGIAFTLIGMSIISLSVAAAKLLRFRRMTTATRQQSRGAVADGTVPEVARGAGAGRVAP